MAKNAVINFRVDKKVKSDMECPHTRFAGQKNNLYNGKG